MHQVVHAEFQGLVSYAKNDFIQLKSFDKDREQQVLQAKKDKFAVDLTSQIGLRWIAEALCPAVDEELPQECIPPNAHGDLTKVFPWSLPPILSNEDDQEGYVDRHSETMCKLQKRGTVLIGHNVFLDLMYFYTCFFGSLPDRVEDFQRVMGRLFPMIFDTKYLADIVNHNSGSYNSSLEDLDRQLSEVPFPLIGKRRTGFGWRQLGLSANGRL